MYEFYMVMTPIISFQLPVSNLKCVKLCEWFEQVFTKSMPCFIVTMIVEKRSSKVCYFHITILATWPHFTFMFSTWISLTWDDILQKSFVSSNTFYVLNWAHFNNLLYNDYDNDNFYVATSQYQNVKC